jgi:hypothetical protein
MYLPYLRDKQNEILALLNLPLNIFKSNKIIPIIEPVTDLKKNKNLKELKNKNIPFILISNPSVGKNATAKVNDHIKKELIDGILADYKNYWIGFIISSKTTLSDIKAFFKTFSNRATALIHDYNFKQAKDLLQILEKENSIQFNVFVENHTSGYYRSLFSDIEASDVLLRDGFRKQENNSLYPQEDFFSDLHLTFKEDGFDGFGDFQMIGYTYKEAGGPAHAVTIHLTTVDEENKSLSMNHFISDNTTGPVDPGGKFLEALKKLNSFLIKHPLYKTEGANQYRSLYKTKHFPGLGVVKKISIMHHIELMHDFL